MPKKTKKKSTKTKKRRTSDAFKGPSKAEMLKFEAESRVSEAFKTTPAFRVAVKQTVAELKTQEAKIKKTIKKTIKS